MVLGMEVGLSPGHFVLHGDPAPITTKGRRPPPQFSAHFNCGQTAGCIKMTLGTEVGLGLRHIVLDVDPATRRKGHTHPTQFLAHVYCGQMAGRMKTPIGTEVDLGPGHITRRCPSSRDKGTADPLFLAHVYCGHDRPSQPLLSSCANCRPKTTAQKQIAVAVVRRGGAPAATPGGRLNYSAVSRRTQPFIPSGSINE